MFIWDEVIVNMIQAPDTISGLVYHKDIIMMKSRKMNKKDKELTRGEVLQKMCKRCLKMRHLDNMIWVKVEKGEKLTEWDFKMMNLFKTNASNNNLRITLVHKKKETKEEAMEQDWDQEDQNAWLFLKSRKKSLKSHKINTDV